MNIRRCAAWLVALALVAQARDTRASCAAPTVQASPDNGLAVTASCGISVAIPKTYSIVDPSKLRLSWSGGSTGVRLSQPSLVAVEQSEPAIDPETCEEKLQSWDVEFQVYDLAPEQALPLDVEIRLMADQEVLGRFKRSATSTSCPGRVTPTVGMCGSWSAPPVAGCGDPSTPDDHVKPSADEGCAIGSSSSAGGAAWPVALLLLVTFCRRRAAHGRGPLRRS